MKAEPTLPYRADVDGLRAIAVLAVVVFHFFPRTLPGGFVGVDIFFVISGYLITGIIVRALEADAFSFATFYVRRARRILPALIVVLIGCYVLGWFTLLPEEFRQLSAQMLSAAAFFANFQFWWTSSYFDGVAQSKPLLHLWSLGIEEQFYLVWPLLLWVTWRSWRRGVVAVTIAIVVASFAWGAVEIERDAVAAFYSPATRAWELLAGALVLQLEAQRPLSPRWAGLHAWLGAGLIAVAIADFDKATPFPGYWALLPVLGTALILRAGPANAWLNRRVLSLRGLVGVGLISYPLYLWHWPLLSFAYVAGVDDKDIGVRTALVAASFVLAFLTYRLVEQPVRLGSHGRAKAIALAGILVAVGLGAWATERAGGLAYRIPERVMAPASYAYDYRDGARIDRCWIERPVSDDAFAPECINPQHAGRVVLLWGDSHAGSFYPGLRDVLAPDVEILEVARSSCLPILEFAHPACVKTGRFVMGVIRRTRPSTVVLFGSWTGYVTPPLGRELTVALEETVRQIKAAGVAKVVLMGPAPKWSRPLPRLLTAYAINNPERPVPADRMAFGLVAEVAAVDAHFAALASRVGAVYVSPMELMCSDDGCLTTVPNGAGALTTWDTAHLTRPSAAWLAAQMSARGLLP